MNVETPQEMLNEDRRNTLSSAFFADPDTILRNKQHLLPEMQSFNGIGTKDNRKIIHVNHKKWREMWASCDTWRRNRLQVLNPTCPYCHRWGHFSNECFFHFRIPKDATQAQELMCDHISHFRPRTLQHINDNGETPTAKQFKKWIDGFLDPERERFWNIWDNTSTHDYTRNSPELFPTSIEFGNMRKNFDTFLILGGNKKIVKSIFTGFAVPWFRDKRGDQILPLRTFFQNKLKTQSDFDMWKIISEERDEGMWVNIPPHTPWLTEPMFNNQTVKPSGKIKDQIISSVKIANSYQPKMSTALITARSILETVDRDGMGMSVDG